MKYENVKLAVARGIYTNILEARDWNVMAAILLDKVMAEKPSPPKYYETFKEYADFAWNIVMNWDIRMVGKLREIFPQHFPVSLKKGNLTCEYDDDGDWAIYAEK